MFLSSIVLSLNELSNVAGLQSIDDYKCTSYAKDLKGRYLDCNEYMAKIVGGTSISQILGKDDFEILEEYEAIPIRRNDTAVIQANELIIFNEPFISSEGDAMIATSIKAPLLSKTKKRIGIVGVSIIRYQSAFNEIIDRDGLSERQLDCLYFLVKGKSIKQTAQTMKLSHRTVEHYIENIKLKLKCDSRAELIERALLVPAIKKRLYSFHIAM